MFLHIGGNAIVRAKDIIAILQVRENAPGHKEMLANITRQQADAVHRIGEETKTVIITSGAVYLSPISSNTLKRRAEYLTLGR